MPNFISEDEIEAAMLQRLQLVSGYDVQGCFTTDPADLNDGSGRTDKREVILHSWVSRGSMSGLLLRINIPSASSCR